jgi:hypothetical protein
MAERKSDRTLAMDSQIMPRLVINIPMPPGAAVPARSPQSQPAQIPQAEPAQPAAAQSR